MTLRTRETPGIQGLDMKSGNIIDICDRLEKQRIEDSFLSDDDFNKLMVELSKNEFRPRLSWSERLFMLTAVTALIGGILLLSGGIILSLMN